MFDSLKSKIKNLFKKAPKDLEEPAEEPVQQPVVEEPTKVEQPIVKEPEVKQPEPPKVEKKPEEPKPEPVKEPVPEKKPVVEEKPVKVPEPKIEKPKAEVKPEVKPEVKKAEPPKVEKKPEEPKPEPAKIEKKPEVKKAEPPKKEPISAPPEDLNLKEGGLFSGKKIKEEELEDLLWELEISLLEADVALPVVDEIKAGVKENLLGKKYKGHSLEEVVELSLKDAVRNVLKNNVFDFDDWISKQSKPVTIMFVGINGTGKTTAIAKIANRLIYNKYSVVLAAADTFRAGAIEQLTIHSEKLGCKIIKHAQDADPAAVCFDAVEHAKSKGKDVVIIDTAGRMQTNNNLINEMKKIVKVAKPHLKVFVGDSLAGNNATEQAKVFDDAIGIDAVILTKIDADSKGGAALSIAHTIGKPIAFVCNGQEYEDIIKFNADWMLNRLFEN